MCGASWSPSPRRRVAGRSHEVELPFRVLLCGAIVSLLGRSPPPWPSPFPADLRGSPRATVPRLLRVRVHPLLGLPPLQRSNHSVRPTARTRSAPPLGFSASIATSMQRVHLAAGFPSLPMFRPQRFARSRRLPPLHTLPACFIRLPRPRFALQGFFPLASPPSSSLAGPLLPFRAFACERVAPRAPAPTDRLQGFDPTTDSLSSPAD